MKLAQSERTQRLLVWIVPPILMFIAYILVLVNNNKVVIVKRSRQEVVSVMQSSKDNSQFLNYLVEHPKELQLIQQSIPSEQMMVSLLEDLEDVVRTFDEEATVTFVGTSPSRVGSDLIIPVVIKCSTSMEQTTQLLNSIRNLPYLLQLTSIESNRTEKGGDHVLGYKLFVQEPFAGL